MNGIPRFLYPSVAVLLSLTGCALSPKYSRPTPPVPPAWHSGTPEEGTPAASDQPVGADLKWQEFFTDAKLRQVIDLALQNNRDLRIAALNVERAQALYRIRRSEQFPNVDASASAQLSRVPSRVSLTGKSYTSEQYSIGAGVAAWELDLFGRVRSLRSQALEQYFATEQARSASQISLVAAVANAYLILGGDRDSLRLAKATLETQQASYNLILQSRDAGIATDLDLKQSQSQVEAARVDVAHYTSQVTLDENALNLLAGTTVPEALLPSELVSARALKDIAAGVPSDVLLRRPDIVASEHQLKAAYANIGAARAAFFPRIALTGSGGIASARLSDLVKAGPGTWNFTPQISLPIFDAGARQANLKIAKVDQDSTVAEYERAIQSGFREVSDSLNQRVWLLDQQDAQQGLVNTLDDTYRLAEARYNAGIDSYLTVLVAQRSLYAAQQSLIMTRLARLGNLVTLYKVLGGGA